LVTHRLGDSGSEAPEIATADVALHHDVALAAFVIDDFRRLDGAHACDLRKSHYAASGRPDESLTDCVRRRPIGCVESHDDWVALAAVDHLARRCPTDTALDSLADVGDVQAVPCDGRTVQLQLELHGARARADEHVLGAAHRLHDLLDLFTLLLEERETVTED